MASLARHCPNCKKYSQIELLDHKKLECPECREEWGEIDTVKNLFDRCPVCTCRQFYSSKDFNQLLGCSIMFLGIIFVPWTYGLSLPFFALIDWLLYKRVETMENCYRCGAEFRNMKSEKDFKPFMHHIGLKYDKYR